jgi:hypothetical protein
MQIESTLKPSGEITLTVRRKDAPVAKKGYGLKNAFKWANPFTAASHNIALYRLRNIPNVWRGFWKVAIAWLFKIPTFYGAVYATVTRANGEVIDYGLISMRVVTDTGVGYIVDAFQNIVEPENEKYHGFGTGGTAEAASQTALVTELTTQYATDNTRPTGSTTEGASANIYRTVGTLSPDATVAITEHGIFSQAATGGGVMLDRSLFSVINLVSGDSLQITYDATFPSGS